MTPTEQSTAATTFADLVAAAPGRLPAEQALPLLRKIADEVRAAAPFGGHGDIHAGTVAIGADGTVSLGPRRTETAATGTGPADDARAFAALVYLALTGVDPDAGPGEPRTITEVLPGLPPFVGETLMRALTAEPARRTGPHALMTVLEMQPAAAWTGLDDAPISMSRSVEAEAEPEVEAEVEAKAEAEAEEPVPAADGETGEEARQDDPDEDFAVAIRRLIAPGHEVAVPGPPLTADDLPLPSTHTRRRRRRSGRKRRPSMPTWDERTLTLVAVAGIALVLLLLYVVRSA